MCRQRALILGDGYKGWGCPNVERLGEGLTVTVLAVFLNVAVLFIVLLGRVVVLVAIAVVSIGMVLAGGFSVGCILVRDQVLIQQLAEELCLGEQGRGASMRRFRLALQ